MNLAFSPGIIGGMRIRLAGRQPLHSAVIGQASSGPTTVTFDASDMTFASPLDLAGISAWTARLRRESAAVSFVLPTDDDVRRYLVRMDLIAELAKADVAITGATPALRRADRADVLLEVRLIRNPADVERFSTDAYELVQLHTSDSSAAAAAKMLGELLDNAITHAGSLVGVYAAAQVHLHAGNVQLAVADGGIGVRSHLARNPCFRDLTAVQALSAALRPGVTGTSERRGNGLPDLLSIASGFGGQLLLRSDDGYAQVKAAVPDRQTTEACHVPGTWAWVHLCLPRGQRRMVSLQQ